MYVGVTMHKATRSILLCPCKMGETNQKLVADYFPRLLTEASESHERISVIVVLLLPQPGGQWKGGKCAKASRPNLCCC